MKNLLCPMLLAFAAFATAAKADTISISLDKPNQIATSGGSLIFRGTITNLTSGTVFLNGDYFTVAGIGYTVNDQFFNTVPISLAAGATSGDIELFDVSAPASPTAASGTYGLTGGPDFNASNNLGSSSFTINTPGSVPEIDPSLAASPLLLIAGGIAVLRGRRIRRTVQPTLL